MYRKIAIAAAALLLFAGGCGNSDIGNGNGNGAAASVGSAAANAGGTDAETADGSAAGAASGTAAAAETTGGANAATADGSAAGAASGTAAAAETTDGTDAVSAEAIEFYLATDEAPLVDEAPSPGSYADFVELADYKGLEIAASASTVIEDGMTVNIDYSGTVNGAEFDGGTGVGYNLQIGSGTFIEDFEEQLKGHKKGDRFIIETKLPDGYMESSLSGKTAQFNVTVNTVYNTLPYVALTQIIDGSTVLKYPKSLYEEWLAAYTDLYASYNSGGADDLDALLDKIGIPKESFLSMVYSSAKNDLVCRAIMDSEGIDTDSARYEEAVTRVVVGYGFDSVDAMLAAGSSQKDIDYAAENQLCCEIIEANGR